MKEVVCYFFAWKAGSLRAYHTHQGDAIWHESRFLFSQWQIDWNL